MCYYPHSHFPVPCFRGSQHQKHYKDINKKVNSHHDEIISTFTLYAAYNMGPIIVLPQLNIAVLHLLCHRYAITACLGGLGYLYTMAM